MTSGLKDFASRVVFWQREHGRQGLPWQQTRDPYRVWLSEIMLQQTQVSTVRAYFLSFLDRFPDVHALAAAPLDDVLGLWSGLGYYSRARNLHRCAKELVQHHGGKFPDNAQALANLPGIGRSTACAVAAFCFDERVAILDGNVKRVLARVLSFEPDLASAANQRTLWNEADALVPASGKDMPAYTQGLMDLGATVCLAKKPLCLRCPVAAQCGARQAGQPERYPVKSRKAKRSSQSLWLLSARKKDASVWLEKRPVPGVWGGLYCLPVFETRDALEQAVPSARRAALKDQAAFLHVLTHKDLHLHPVASVLAANDMNAREGGAWFTAQQWQRLGLPAPIRKLLEAG